MKPGQSRGIPVLVIVAALAASPATGQLAPGMDGRANDANNQIGSGGFNTSVARPIANSGNLFVTGNVTGGRAFQGFSPIRDSSSLPLSLPSAALGRFQRDTIGIGEVLRNRPIGQVSPYFNPYSTTGTAGLINAGLTRPGSSVPRTTFVAPHSGYSVDYRRGFGTRPIDPGLGAGLRTSVDGLAPNSSIHTQANMPLIREVFGEPMQLPHLEALRKSPVFGQSIVSTTALTKLAPTTIAGSRDPFALPVDPLRARPTAPIDRNPAASGRSFLQPSSERMLAGSRDALSPTLIAPKLFNPPPGTPRAGAPVDALRPPTLAGIGTPLPPVSGLVDVARDLRIAPEDAGQVPRDGMIAPTTTLFGTIESNWIEEPPDDLVADGLNPLVDVAWAVQWLTEVQQDPDFASQLTAQASLRQKYERVVSTVRSVSEEAVETLAGRNQSKLNDLLIRAERCVHDGEYYRASTIYRLAESMDPRDPLIRLGHGHALLAAGEYLTAVHKLTNAIEDYPAFGYLKLDLIKFIRDPNLLDRRRADLEDRLERRDDYRLRFLLGYTETYTGLEKFGIPNLERAAESAPEGSVIARFPEMLRSKLVPLTLTPTGEQ